MAENQPSLQFEIRRISFAPLSTAYLGQERDLFPTIHYVTTITFSEMLAAGGLQREKIYIYVYYTW